MNQKNIALRDFEEINDWDTVMFLYKSALKQINTKIEILNDEFQQRHKYNPIEHVKSRIKTPESIVKKLRRHHYDDTIENMVLYVNDIAGIRITCSFTSDIYRIGEMIANQSDLKILSIKDYMKNPKGSGYRSYHILATVPVHLSDQVIDTKVEIQIRTVAQDFWATLEHKMHYKFEGDGPDYIAQELKACAKYVAELDARMEELNNEIQQYGDMPSN
ncbi:MAG: GTP pyrophosphokinase family protein [Eubacteriales bacterium]|nr:GTP pyrophosphokinase family protein [Eubacteriales bacterium]